MATNSKKIEKSAAMRTWVHWGRHAVELLREKGVNLEKPEAGANRQLEDLIVARAYAESMDKPKIHLRYEYPIEMFLNKRGAPRGDAFECALPSTIDMTKLFIPFQDGSVMLVVSPSEETIQCAKYIKLFANNPDLAQIVGVDAIRLANLKEIVDLVDNSSRVAALTKMELSQYIDREKQATYHGAQPAIRINLATESVSSAYAVGVLLDFFDHPSDTVTNSVEQLIASEFVRGN